MSRHTVYLTVTEQTLWRVTVDADTPEQATTEARRLLREEGWDHAKTIEVIYSEVDRIRLKGSPSTFCRNCGAHITETTDTDSGEVLVVWQSIGGQTRCEDGDQHEPGPTA